MIRDVDLAPKAARRGATDKRQVLALFPDAWDREALARPLRGGYKIVFHGAELAASASAFDALRFDVFRWADATAARFRDAGISGVIGTGDYPGCMVAALVAERLGLPAPPPARVVLLSHKYYSRELQRRIAPEATPAYEAIDPFARRLGSRLGYPLFVKPVRSTMSIRARMVHDGDDLRRALTFGLCERIEKRLLLFPFGQLLRRYSDGAVPAHWFIAEAPLSGVQVTVDGFVERGRAVIMGVVDSVMYAGTQSFARFEYPSRLPRSVQARMADIARRLMEGSVFDASCFNIEMFWDEPTDAIRVIEINPRMSYQFGDLHEHVDGTHSYAVQLALATGEPVCWIPRAGPCGAAASFVLRRFTDARVARVPSADEISAITTRLPGTTVKVLCEPGRRLSHYYQDVGSYRYAIVNMGAPSRTELLERWAEVERSLRFVFA